jgi:hypothetical protein
MQFSQGSAQTTGADADATSHGGVHVTQARPTTNYRPPDPCHLPADLPDDRMEEASSLACALSLALSGAIARGVLDDGELGISLLQLTDELLERLAGPSKED